MIAKIQKFLSNSFGSAARPLTRVIAFSGLALLLGACSLAASFMMPSESEMAQKGGEAFQQIKQQIPAETNPRINGYVQCIARNILESMDDQNPAEWEVVVFRHNAVNAFAIPGKKIGVFTGLLQVARTQDQLAAVMGHEVAHVTERHSAEQQARRDLTAAALEAAASAAEKQTGKEGTGDLVMQGGEIAAQYGLFLPFSREHESEADEVGVRLMARAGFDPRAAVELWQNMQQLGGGGPEFLSTHPSHETRIEDLNDLMSDAYMIYQQAQQNGRKPSCSL